jgi:hypothetical protein
VILSAKHSTGFVQAYHWSFAYARGADPSIEAWTIDPQIPPLQICRKEAVEISFVALRSLRVTLTITDSEGRTDSTPADVNVKPREWRTRFTSDPKVKPVRGSFQPGWWFLGRNTCSCSLEWDKPAGHYLHWKPSDSTEYAYENNDIGFAVKQVSDPGGPFHGFWYVESYKAYVHRTLLVNSKFFPGGDIYDINQGSGEHRKSVDTLAKSVSAHEQVHSDLIRKSLKDFDPAKKIEMLMSGDGTRLRQIANQACVDADEGIEKGHSEQDVHRQLRTMGFQLEGELEDGSGGLFKVRKGGKADSFADLGDEER